MLLDTDCEAVRLSLGIDRRILCLQTVKSSHCDLSRPNVRRSRPIRPACLTTTRHCFGHLNVPGDGFRQWPVPSARHSLRRRRTCILDSVLSRQWSTRSCRPTWTTVILYLLTYCRYRTTRHAASSSSQGSRTVGLYLIPIDIICDFL